MPPRVAAKSHPTGEYAMADRNLTGLGLAAVFATALVTIATAPGRAADNRKYPSWKGQWLAINFRLGGQVIKYDPNKAWGPAQQAPLTPEYQKVLEESMAEQAEGGLGNYPTARCLPGGMPRMMAAPTQEYIITPETTYISTGQELRRIFTDGRDWPARSREPTYQGYSIGRWLDEDGDGTYDTLEVETRMFKGPRAYDASGLPLDFDNQSVFRERFYIDKTNPNLLHDEITTIDHALTRPWSVDKTFRRSGNSRPDWGQRFCTEGNNQIVVGDENYFLSADGLLMPAKKDQPPPDLRYFKRTQR
jgi:hypothetical protein